MKYVITSKIALTCLCIFWEFNLLASIPNDSVSTRYEKGDFITYNHIVVNAPREIVNEVMRDFIYQTKYDLNGLYNWGLKGLRLRKENDDLLVFNFKSTNYDAQNDIIKNTGDVHVSPLITFPNIHVNTRMTKKDSANGTSKVDIALLYSDSFLKKTTGQFHMTPLNENYCLISLETKVRFGWFFDVFITTKNYSGIMQWRFTKLMQNIAAEAERRAARIKKN